MNINIRDEYDESDIQNMTSYILKQPQYYPKFKEWVNDKLYPRLLSSRYKSIICTNQHDIIGCLVYDDSDKHCTLIKNFRIDPLYKNKSIGYMLLRNLDNISTKLLTDISVNNFEAVQFFIKYGFNIQSMEQLYSDRFEYIIEK